MGKKYKHIGKSMRMELSILRKKGYSLRAIARELGVNPSSLSRELSRNSSRDHRYDGKKAHHKAYVRRKYSKYEGMKICKNSWLENYVKEKLKFGWTPEEISGRLNEDYGTSIISFKSIYKWLYSVRGQDYTIFLPSRHDRPRRWRKRGKRVLIPDRIFIDHRPVEASERTEPFHFEGDTLGKPKGKPQTLAGSIDRLSRYFLAKKVSQLKYAMNGFKELFDNIPVKSYTLDNGVENTTYKILGVPTYFCHPYHSWEKGTIENTFQRLRRYIPKGSDLADFSQATIASIVKRMNNTPRKCLHFRTPAEVFKEQLVNSGSRVLHFGG